jgi:drug/metabolite transporter (DMT)-like permease
MDVVIDAKVMALIAAVTFGMAPVTLKVAYRAGGNTNTGMVIGLAVAVPINFALVPFMDPHWEQLNLGAIVGFVLGGLAGNAIGRQWLYQAIDLLGPARASVLRSASPIITTILALLLYQEAVTPVRWAAVLAIVLGGVLVSWSPGSGARGWMSAGVVFALAAAVSYGTRPIFVKFGLEQANLPLAGACIGAVVALAWGMIGDRSYLRETRLDRSFRWFFIGGVIQALALLALTFALSAGDVSLVYPLSTSAPLFTVLFSAVFLRGVEPIGRRLILGALAVVLGVVFLE